MAQDVFFLDFFLISLCFTYQIHLLFFSMLKWKTLYASFHSFLYKNAVVYISLYIYIYIYIIAFVVVPVNCANSAVTQVAGDCRESTDQPKEQKRGKTSKLSAKLNGVHENVHRSDPFVDFKVFRLIIQDILGE